MGPKPTPIGVRLNRYRRIEADGCWSWTGKIGRNGYGQIGIDHKSYGVHRVAYAHHIGPIPDGMRVTHTCGKPTCINPAHLLATDPPRKGPRIARASGAAEITDQAAVDRIVGGYEVTGYGCWIWLERVAHNGYGALKIGGRRIAAHRAAYLASVGPLAEGEVLDHLCRNRLCVNPDHLEAVSDRENLRRGNGPNRINARKTHCIRGHEFTPENTRWQNRSTRPAPSRACRACDALYNTDVRPNKKAVAA